MKVSAAVIAGGKSTRMGRDKALLPVRGHGSLLESQFSLLMKLRPAELLLSCRAGQFPEISRGVRLVCDDGNLGPLGGLAALLRSCRTEFLMVLAVDLPRMTLPTLRRIAAQAAFSGGRGAVPRSRLGIEPLAAVYPVGILDLAERQIRSDTDHSLRTLTEAGIQSGLLNWHPVGDAESPRFFNWNRLRSG